VKESASAEEKREKSTYIEEKSRYVDGSVKRYNVRGVGPDRRNVLCRRDDGRTEVLLHRTKSRVRENHFVESLVDKDAVLTSEVSVRIIHSECERAERKPWNDVEYAHADRLSERIDP
jgi:hypothetical protein